MGVEAVPEEEEISSYLFQEAERGQKSTVAAKSAEIGIFQQKIPTGKWKAVKNIQDETPKSTNIRTMIFIGLIGVGIIFLFTVSVAQISE